MNANVVNIAMITDNAYVMPTTVAIKSMSINKKKDSVYNINIITTGLTKLNKKILKNCCEDRVEINIIEQNQIISKYSAIPQERHVTRAALLKFYLPEIFNNLDRILYLDSDLVVQQDLSELYNTEIDTFYAAVVKDVVSVVNRDYMKQIGIENDYYFNSGVMLLNLELMRNDNIPEKLVNFRRSKKQHYMDQDAFNAIIGHNVKYLSYKYNFQNYDLTVLNKKQLSELFEEDLQHYNGEIDLYKHCTILHFGGKDKPWAKDLGFLSDVYKHYHRKTFYPLDSMPLYKEQMSWLRFKMPRPFRWLFSYSSNGVHRIITICGIKIKFKSHKYFIKSVYNKLFEDEM